MSFIFYKPWNIPSLTNASYCHTSTHLKISNIFSLVDIVIVYLNNIKLYFSGTFTRFHIGLPLLTIVSITPSVHVFYWDYALQSTYIIFPIYAAFDWPLFLPTRFHQYYRIELESQESQHFCISHLAALCSTISSLYSWHGVNFIPLLLSIIISKLWRVSFISNFFDDLWSINWPLLSGYSP